MPYFFKMPPRLIITNFYSPDVSHVLSFDCKIVNATKSKQIKIQSQVYCEISFKHHPRSYLPFSKSSQPGLSRYAAGVTPLSPWILICTFPSVPAPEYVEVYTLTWYTENTKISLYKKILSALGKEIGRGRLCWVRRWISIADISVLKNEQMCTGNDATR